MIISEKQIMRLILLAKNFQVYLIGCEDFECSWGKEASKLLDEIRNQQSEELKEIK